MISSEVWRKTPANFFRFCESNFLYELWDCIQLVGKRSISCKKSHIISACRIKLNPGTRECHCH